MNITYRCMKCGSNDIDVKFYRNLKTGNFFVHEDTIYEKCYCNGCKEWSTFGWMELETILEMNKNEENK